MKYVIEKEIEKDKGFCVDENARGEKRACSVNKHRVSRHIDVSTITVAKVGRRNPSRVSNCKIPGAHCHVATVRALKGMKIDERVAKNAGRRTRRGSSGAVNQDRVSSQQHVTTCG